MTKNYQWLSMLCIIICCYSCLPSPPPYPHKPSTQIISEAQAYSNNLEQHIIGWLNGTHSAQIPDSLIPPGIVDNHSFYLKHPDSVHFSEVWLWRERAPIDLDSVYNGVPDPNASYLLLGPALAPFGSKLHLEGEFPKARFFSIQMSPPLDGEQYCYNRVFGPAEVSIVDVDIDPMPGHVNPYRIGANRQASNRSYHVTYQLSTGNPVTLSNGNFAPPYRYAGNTRHGSLLQYQGPWGVQGGFDGLTPGTGEWNVGALWCRIYAPDHNTDAFGDAPFPKVYYELPDGRRYFIGANFEPTRAQTDTTMVARTTTSTPNPNIDASKGWSKSYGILRSILSGVIEANGWTHPDSLEKARNVDLGVTGRGMALADSRSYEPSATGNNYVNYVGRFARTPSNYVTVLTGKLPTFPDTRTGTNTMTGAECRYWSIVGYDNDALSPLPGAAINSVMDDEVALDANRNYIICYSQPNDRPNNATSSNGVTWVNWGPTMDLGLMIRYLSVDNGWSFGKTPDEIHLPANTSDFLSPNFDPNLLYKNWHKGWLSCYLPRVHYMTKQQFEALGSSITAQQIPIWVHDKFELGLNDGLNLPISSSSNWDNTGTYSADKANDNDINSRWSSQFLLNPANPEWLCMDLGSVQTISAIKLGWEFSSYAKTYDIQVSNDSLSWSTIYSTTTGNGVVDLIDHLQTSGRYVRIYMTVPNSVNYSLHFFEVYSPDLSCNTTTTSINQTQGNQTTNVQVYPNPSNGTFNIDAKLVFDQIKVYQLNGQLVHHMNYQTSFTLDLPKGVYLLQLDGQQSSITKKILIQ